MCARAKDDLTLKTVAIDAGHGGTDPGAVSPDKKTYEKSLTLDISRRLASKISLACPDVKVVQTRPDDKFVELGSRAAIANKAGADLFISIHINSSKSTSPSGYSVHLLGESSNKNKDLFAYNMDVCRRENSVILLEDDYSTRYQGFDPSDPESFIFMQLMQNSHLEQSLEFAQKVSAALKGGPVSADRGIWQNPFLVLWRTAMPSVLIELGFISNAGDLSVLRSEANRDKIAERIKDAFVAYKTEYDASVNFQAAPAATEAGRQLPSEGKNEGGMPSFGHNLPASGTVSNGAAGLPAAVEGPENRGNGPSTAQTAPAEDKKSTTGTQAAPAEDKKSTTGTQAAPAGMLYGTQVMSGSKKLDPRDKMFAGYSVEIVKVGSVYKYILGVSSSPEEAREKFLKIRSKFPGAFMVQYSNRDFPAPYRGVETK